MTWQILILISVVTLSIGTLYQRVVLKDDRSDPIAYGIVFQLLVSGMMFIYGSIYSELSLPDLLPLIPNLLLVAILYSAVTILLFRSLKLIEASQFTVIVSSSGLFTVLASSILLGETLSGLQWLGALGIFGGLAIVSLKSLKIKFGKGEKYALLGAVLLGFAVTNDIFLLKTFELYTYMSLSFLLPSLLLLVLYPSSIHKLSFMKDKSLLKKMLIHSFLYGVGVLTLFGAFQMTTNSSPVVVISKVSVILTAFLAVIFLKERDNVTRKLLGALVSFIGLVILSLT